MGSPLTPSSTLVEALTAQFYAWERRGRGWQVWPYPVELEPPFVPFSLQGVSTPRPSFDDGRTPTLLSSVVDGVRGLFARKSDPASSQFSEDDLDPVDPNIFEDDGSINEIQLAVPPDLPVSIGAAEQLLLALSSQSPVAFEIVGDARTITLQLAFRDEADGIAQSVKAHFPDLVLTPSDGFLARSWERSHGTAAIVDFGLSQEFMLPLRTVRNFEVDPLLGILSALSMLQGSEIAVVQVLFQRVRHPWNEGMLRAVLGPEGDSFFLDASREFVSLAEQKASRPLFACVIRVAAKAGRPDRAFQIARTVGRGLRLLTDPSANELIPLENDGYDHAEHEEDLLLRRSHRTGMLLSSEELISLVHVPGASVRIEKLARWARKTRHAPTITRGHRLVLGTNVHAGNAEQVTLGPEQRSRHMHLIGASGTGKSTLLLNLICQDLENGDGLAVLDPHGDLVDAIVERLPEKRLDDVILFDPADAEYPVGFNILSAHSELERTLLSSDLVAVFRRMSETWGDQMNAVFANAILAFLESTRGGTLLDLRRFLLDPVFRREILGTVTDQEIVYYWEKEFPHLSGRPQSAILTRLDSFLRPRLIRNMVAQRESRLDFRHIMDDGKVFLAKLGVGAIGEESANLLGTFLVAKLQQTAMSRQEVGHAKRRPFYLYIDEFQNFITPTMAQILSGARKYGLGLVLAHQDLQQLGGKDADVLSAVIANPYTRICFRVGDHDAKTLEKGFASFDAKDLQNLGTGQAICRVERAEYDFTMETSALPTLDEEAANERREAVLTRSRSKYARNREEIETLLRASAASAMETETATASVEDCPAPKQRKSAVQPPEIERVDRRATEPLPQPPPSLPTPGRGGQQHKYLQELLRKWGEARDWGASVEERILDGFGCVDVALRKGEVSVACEIGVSSTPEQELQNIQKCLAGGFTYVLSVSSEKKLQQRTRALAEDAISAEDFERIRFCAPEEAFTVLEGFEAETAGAETTHRGRKVRVMYRALGETEKAARRQTVSRVIAKALSRLGSEE